MKSCGGLVSCSLDEQEGPVLNSGFRFMIYNNENLARRATRCDADSSPPWQIEARGKIEFECGLDEDREHFACRSTFRALLHCATIRQDLFAVCASVQKLISSVPGSVPATTPARDWYQCFQLVYLRPRRVQL